MQSIQEAVEPVYQPMGTCRRLLTHVPTRPVPGTQGTSEFEPVSRNPCSCHFEPPALASALLIVAFKRPEVLACACATAASMPTIGTDILEWPGNELRGPPRPPPVVPWFQRKTARTAKTHSSEPRLDHINTANLARCCPLASSSGQTCPIIHGTKYFTIILLLH